MLYCKSSYSASHWVSSCTENSNVNQTTFWRCNSNNNAREVVIVPYHGKVYVLVLLLFHLMDESFTFTNFLHSYCHLALYSTTVLMASFFLDLSVPVTRRKLVHFNLGHRDSYPRKCINNQFGWHPEGTHGVPMEGALPGCQPN